MKINLFSTILFSALLTLNGFAQVAINKDGSTANSAAILQVKGDNNGTPVQAMYIESETGNVGIGTTTPGFPLTFKDVLGNKISLYGQSGNHYGFGIQHFLFQIFTDSASSDIAFGYGSSTNFTELMRIKGTGQAAIGTSTPDASAVLELSSTDKGWLPPRLTQTQMEAISTPATGTYVYNTNLKTLCVYNGSKWTCYDNQSVFNAQFVCGDSLIDYRDSSSYSTVQIGNQCWMSANLNLGTMISSSYNQANNDTIEKFCYNDQEDSCDVYGGLYQWNEMMNYVSASGAQGVCPTGWHIPSDAEWKTMEMALGMSQQSADSTDWRGTNEGGMLKDTGTIYWNTPNTGATNSSGFTALGTGFRTATSSFDYLKNRGTIWTSSQTGGLPLIRRLDFNTSKIYRNTSQYNKGRTVRCVRD